MFFETSCEYMTYCWRENKELFFVSLFFVFMLSVLNIWNWSLSSPKETENTISKKVSGYDGLDENGLCRLVYMVPSW